MRRSIIALVVLALVGVAAYTVFAGGKECSKPCGSSGQASAANSCGLSKGAVEATAVENPRGKLTGNFDPVMSSACRFACATKLEYDPKNVIAQPGAKTAKLTQCPVSGVVFAVDASRPHVKVSGDEYVTCCDKCAAKLKKDPRHYLKA